MAKLPKIARERLRQRNDRSPVDLRSAGGLNATRAASLDAGQHPDANLLAAFGERRLAGSERTLLLGHLADCAQCRELVALAFPSPEVQAAVAEATRPGSGSPVWLRWPVWLGWGTLRWGVLAASVGVVLIGGFQAGVLRWPASQKSRHLTSKSTVAENKQPSVLRAADDSSSSVRGAPSPRRELAEPDGLESGNAPAKPAEPLRPAAQYHAGLKTKLKKQETASAPGARSAGGVLQAGEAAPLSSPDVAQVPPAKTAQAYSNERDGERRAGQLSAAQESAAPDKAVPSIGFAAPSDAQQDRKVNRLPVQKPLGLQQVEVQADALAQKNTGRADSKVLQSARANSITRTPASPPPLPAPPPPPAQPQPVQATQALRLLDGLALTKDKRLLSARWSIASVAGPCVDDRPTIGRVERSLDGGKTWQELHVNDRVSFQAVAANGAEVWAGGSRGALYHSTDSGQHWARVPVGLGQGVVTDTIVGIDVGDRGHVSVTTDAHETWVTADGGLHWTRQ